MDENFLTKAWEIWEQCPQYPEKPEVITPEYQAEYKKVQSKRRSCSAKVQRLILKECKARGLEHCDCWIYKCVNCGEIKLGVDFPIDFSKHVNPEKIICKTCQNKKSYQNRKNRKLSQWEIDYADELALYRKDTPKRRIARDLAKAFYRHRFTIRGNKTPITKEEQYSLIGINSIDDFVKMVEEKLKEHDNALVIEYNDYDYIRSSWCEEDLKDKAREYQKQYYSNRAKEDQLYVFKMRIRGNIRSSFRQRGWKKNSHTQEIIGCTFEELKAHLEKTWEQNYGTPYNGEDVHIDHIVPLATAKTQEDVIKLCHWTNLQYLKPEDNLSKHDKLDWSLEETKDKQTN